MDGALSEKVEDIFPWLVPGLVVDRGCGSGALIRHLAEKNIPAIGVELSDSLAQRHVGVIHANAQEQIFIEGRVSNTIFSSVLHEIFSYNGYHQEEVLVALEIAARELRRGGRIIIRDIWSPEEEGPQYPLRLDERVERVLERFRSLSPVDFQIPIPCGESYSVEGDFRPTIKFSQRAAVEFLSKKEYSKTFQVEVEEIYTALPLSFYQEAADRLALKVVLATTIRNNWIVQNLWRPGVQGDLPPLTNQIVVLEK